MGYATWLEDPCYELCLRRDVAPLDAYSLLLGEAGHLAEHRGPVTWRDDPIPTPEEAKAVLCDPHTPSQPSEFFKFAQATLPKSSKFYAPIFNPAKPLVAGVGERYKTARSAASWASRELTGHAGVEPIHLFALFYDQIAQWGEDDGTDKLFVEHLWTFCEHFWSLDTAKVKQQALEAQQGARDAQAVIQGMVDGVARWHAPIAQMDYAEARRWILRRLIISISGSVLYYVMDVNGCYSPNGVTTQQLMPALIERGLGKIIKLKNEEGKYRESRDILNHYSTSVHALRYEAGAVHSRIENTGTPNATLVFGVYKRRDDLEPEWSDVVDDWLRVFGGRSYALLCEWIGHALAFDEGALPLLSIVGRPDCGKKLLVRGLAECLVEPVVATGQALFGDWNDSLLRSPFVNINEGWSLSGVRHPADRLREVIGDAEIALDRKMKDTATLTANLRIIITSNTVDTLGRIGLGKDLNEASQDALTERILHINVPVETSDWLAKRGGMKFTRGWIKPDKMGDKAEPSRYIIAKHFLKLHQMTQPLRDQQTSRFLMSGLRQDANSQEVIDQFRAANPALANVALALFRYLSAADAAKHGQQHSWLDKVYIDKENKDIYVIAGGALEYMKSDDFFDTRDMLALKAFTTNLDRLTKPVRINNRTKSLVSSCSRGRYLLQSRRSLGAQQWKLLDLEALSKLSDSLQYPCPVLERFVGDGAAILPFPQQAEDPPLPDEEAVTA